MIKINDREHVKVTDKKLNSISLKKCLLQSLDR